MSVLQESLYFGFVISLAAYLIGCWLKKKGGLGYFEPASGGCCDRDCSAAAVACGLRFL